MKDVMLEESSFPINQQKDKTISIFCLVLFSIFTPLTILFILSMPMSGENLLIRICFNLFFLLISAGLSILFFVLYKKFNVSYDYSLVTDALYFSKVIHNSSRKDLASFPISAIKKIGKYGSSDYFYSSELIKPEILTPNKTNLNNCYYILATYRGMDRLFILECSQNFILTLVNCIGKHVLERNFII